MQQNLSELISTRLSHDIIGNIGAVANAAELLEEGDMDFLDDIKSILKTLSSSIPFRCLPTTPAARMRKKHSAELKKNTNFCYVS